jgi:hypothetical protein
MRTGVLAKSRQQRHLHTAIGKLISPPKCAAYYFAKARRKSTSTRKHTHARVTDFAGGLKKNTLMPGEEVSIDHFIFSTLGRLYYGFGKTDNTRHTCSLTVPPHGYMSNTKPASPPTRHLVRKNGLNSLVEISE